MFASGGHTTHRFLSFVMRLRPIMEGSRASFAERACPEANASDCQLFYNCIVRNFMRVMHFTFVEAFLRIGMAQAVPVQVNTPI